MNAQCKIYQLKIKHYFFFKPFFSKVNLLYWLCPYTPNYCPLGAPHRGAALSPPHFPWPAKNTSSAN